MEWRCPICGRLTDSTQDPDFPFCGPRCRLIDLGQWAAEEYRFSEPFVPLLRDQDKPAPRQSEPEPPAPLHDKSQSGS